MNNSNDPNSRRNFLKLSAGAGLVTALGSEAAHGSDTAAPGSATTASARRYNTEYRGSGLNHVAFPLGGIGAGMFCLEGTGALSHFSIRNRPDIFNEPCMFAALVVRGPESVARRLAPEEVGT